MVIPELTLDAKRKILGLNSAKLYGIKGVETGEFQKRFKPVPEDYEKRMSEGAEDDYGVSGIYGRQHVEVQGRVRGRGRREVSYSVRLGPNQSVARSRLDRLSRAADEFSRGLEGARQRLRTPMDKRRH